MPKITKRTVDALKPHERERVVWDDDLKGFGVRVHPSGRKVFIVKTRFGGRIIKMTIGPCTAVSATYARVRAAEIITDARAGKNPAGRRSKAPTMRDLGKRFLKDYVPDHCKASTAEEYRRSIELFIDPRIGNRCGCRTSRRSDIADTPSQHARHPLSGQPNAGGLVEDDEPRGAVGNSAGWFEPLPAREAVQGGEARALPVGRGIPAPGHGA